MKFMKGMYIIWPDYDYIDKAIDSGIDTLLINLNSGDSKEKTKELFERYHNKVELVPTIAWMQPHYFLFQDQQFFDGDKFYENTACPTSVDYIKNLLKFPLELYNNYSCKSVGIDFESYGIGKYHGVIEYYKLWENGYICKCNRCKNLSQYEQRIINAENIQKELGPASLYHLPCVNPFIWRIGNYWFNEFTYEKWGAWGRILKNTYKMKKKLSRLPLNTSGLWMEKFTARDYLDRLKEIVKSPATDGYWLYPQMRMSKNCYWRLHPEDPYSKESLAELPYHSFIDASNDPTSDPYFFSKLKEINNNIDGWRSGWWFGIGSLIYGFFR